MMLAKLMYCGINIKRASYSVAYNIEVPKSIKPEKIIQCEPTKQCTLYAKSALFSLSVLEVNSADFFVLYMEHNKNKADRLE